MKMRIWPKTVEEWLRSILSVLTFFFVLFLFLAIASHYVAERNFSRHLFGETRYYDLATGYMGLCLNIAGGLLLIFSLTLAVAGYWRIASWGLFCLSVAALTVFMLGTWLARAREKPVIYLYPERDQAINVKLLYDGTLVHAYPEYPPDGWQVNAKPSGELVNVQTGRTHHCLFWEGSDLHAYRLDEGFVVAGKDTTAFLESTLAALGLSEREANEFIIYWLPRMEMNAFNAIYFPSEEYSRHARLEITPAPDTLIRVFMVFKPIAKPVDIRPPALKPVVRRGFTVVEWGGTELD
jgi:hypothetical protein